MPGFFVFSPESLRGLRVERGLSREQLAIDSDSSYSAIALYETGHRSPSRPTLRRLAAALDVEPTALVVDDPAFVGGGV